MLARRVVDRLPEIRTLAALAHALDAIAKDELDVIGVSLALFDPGGRVRVCLDTAQSWISDAEMHHYARTRYRSDRLVARLRATQAPVELDAPATGSPRAILGPIAGDGHVCGAFGLYRRQPFAPGVRDAVAVLSLHLSAWLARRSSGADPASPLRGLTARQREVAALAAQGETNPAMSEHLQLSLVTVKKHLSLAYTKLGVRNRAQLAALLARATEPAAALVIGEAPGVRVTEA